MKKKFTTALPAHRQLRRQTGFLGTVRIIAIIIINRRSINYTSIQVRSSALLEVVGNRGLVGLQVPGLQLCWKNRDFGARNRGLQGSRTADQDCRNSTELRRLRRTPVADFVPIENLSDKIPPNINFGSA